MRDYLMEKLEWADGAHKSIRQTNLRALWMSFLSSFSPRFDTPKKENKVAYLDGLRGFAAFMVSCNPPKWLLLKFHWICSDVLLYTRSIGSITPTSLIAMRSDITIHLAFEMNTSFHVCRLFDSSSLVVSRARIPVAS